MQVFDYRKYYNELHIHYIAERCPMCGQQKMRPMDSKFRCDNCHHLEDFFQDGDTLEM